MHDPLSPGNSKHNATLGVWEMAFNFVFTAEMILRVLAVGGILPHFRNPWNVFDAVMVCAGYTQFLPIGDGDTDGGSSTSGIRALRAIRALRPLRCGFLSPHADG
jgi:hypothetical protein